MKKIYLLIYIITILSFLTSSLKSSENKILVKLNNQIITSLDIASEIKYLETININFKKFDESKIIEIAKKSLIRDKIKEIELKKIFEEIKIQDEFFAEISKSYFDYLGISSIIEFKDFFENEGIDPSEVRKKITLEILWNQFIYKKFYANVKIDKDKIEKDLLKKKNTQKEFLLLEILFDVAENENVKSKFNLIKDDINNKGFSNAAIIHSISNSKNLGGKLGWIKESVLNEKIKVQIEKLKQNDFTNPIVVPGGFLILKKEDLREVNIQVDIEKEIKLIIDKKTNQQLNQFSNIYFNKIKKNIKIYEL